MLSDAARAVIEERRQLDRDFDARKISATDYCVRAGQLQRQWDRLPASERTPLS